MVRLLLLALLVVSCNESFNAGVTKHNGLLPVDGRNPVILLNDSPKENWQGEYAMLLANSGGPKLVGIIVTTGGVNTDLDENRKGWEDMVDAARNGGLKDIPDPSPSLSDALLRPASGNILDTTPQRSIGARLIVDESIRLSQPYRPLVVVSASRLTDVASAYLMDPTIVDRIWVVASVGVLTSTGATMDKPNGEMDPWASTIVASRLPYIQVSARYNSKLDVPDARLQDLPRNNKFSDWIYYKQPNIWSLTDAADQVSIEAVGIPGFVTGVDPVSLDTTVNASATAGPPLQRDPTGRVQLVRQISADVGIDRLWQMLQDSRIFPTSPDASVDTK